MTAAPIPAVITTGAAATEVTPTILEVYFTNTCNMACVYCGPQHSSRWAEENRRFGSTFSTNTKFSVQDTAVNPNYSKMVTDLWKYLEEHNRYETLRRFHVLGGEPFVIPELDNAISFWDQHPNINLVFNIVTNLNIPHKRFLEYMNRFKKLIDEKKIWKIEITASIDAWGSEQEYTRFGLNLGQWEKNFNYLVDQQWVTLSINSVISALTIKQLPLLMEKINEWNAKRGPIVRTNDNVFGEPIYHAFLTSSFKDSIHNFDRCTFEQDFTKALAVMPECTEHQKAIKGQLSSIALAHSRCVANHNKIADLKSYLTELDTRRQTDWTKTFPWLAGIN